MEQYAEFLVSEIKNTCHSWTGNKNQIRFHPIIANVAMNLYCGMNLEAAAAAFPILFPTKRSVQRYRAKVATHEGTDPSIYARVAEMGGFTTETEKLVDIIFDEVKIHSLVAWNAKNDDFRGLCCGTTGSITDLKDLLLDSCTNDNKPQQHT